jgi:hypothetical protein
MEKPFSAEKYFCGEGFCCYSNGISAPAAYTVIRNRKKVFIKEVIL